MNQFRQLLAMIQEDAASLPRGELKKEIQVNLEILSEYLADIQKMRPDAAMEDKISATDNLLVAALVTALYVRELTTRPMEREFARVRISFN
jgi:hypothetical protein